MRPFKTLLVPLNKPMTREEISQLVNQGWSLYGQVVWEKRANLATVDNPEAQSDYIPCNLWVLHTGMMPSYMVAQTIIESESKEDLCQQLFGASEDELAEMMEGEQE